MGDLKGAPVVHLNFPLQSFSMYITFKLGLLLLVSLFLWSWGGLVNAYRVLTVCTEFPVFTLRVISNNNPIPKVWASMQGQFLF